MTKIISIPLAIILSVFSLIFPAKDDKVESEKWNTNYPYVFVHGLMGWGSYDSQYKLMPYWGMFGGELLGKLEKQGFDCYAASVAPFQLLRRQAHRHSLMRQVTFQRVYGTLCPFTGATICLSRADFSK